MIPFQKSIYPFICYVIFDIILSYQVSNVSFGTQSFFNTEHLELNQGDYIVECELQHKDY